MLMLITCDYEKWLEQEGGEKIKSNFIAEF